MTTPSILIVDDYHDTGASLADILTDRGYRVDVAQDGPSALELVRQNEYRMVFLEHELRGMGGMQLWMRIRRMRPGVIAVLLTLCATESLVRRARQAGLRGVLPKPLDVDALLRLIEEVVREKSESAA